jgi:hypothetical protein
LARKSGGEGLERLRRTVSPNASLDRAMPLHTCQGSNKFFGFTLSPTYDLQYESLIPSLLMATNSIKLLTGNSHPALAKLVADRLGIELTKILVAQYANQETSVTIGESVRDEDGMELQKRCRFSFFFF